MDQFKKYLQVLNALEKEGVEYVLIGGVAVILHGLQRLTRDIDIFIKMTPENILKLRKALFSIFKDKDIEEITYEDLLEYPVIRYGTPDNFFIDIMAKLGEVATFNDLDYDVIEVEGSKINIATPETLYFLKKDTIRPEDKRDAFFLKEVIKNKSD